MNVLNSFTDTHSNNMSREEKLSGYEALEKDLDMALLSAGQGA